MDSKSFLEISNFEKKHWWFRGRKRIINMFLNKLKLNINSNILEIGCGTGVNLDQLSNFGTVYALEPSEDAIYYIRKKKLSNINLRKGKCPEDLDYEEKFDLVCMFDVLEHIEKDKETIEKISKILKINGRILLTVPAYQWLFSKHDIKLMHKRRYTLNNLKKLITNQELSIEYSTYFNTFLFPFAVIERIVRKFIYIDEKNPNMIINFIFEKIFILEKYLLKIFRFPFGLSLLMIIKKS